MLVTSMHEALFTLSHYISTFIYLGILWHSSIEKVVGVTGGGAQWAEFWMFYSHIFVCFSS